MPCANTPLHQITGPAHKKDPSDGAEGPTYFATEGGYEREPSAVTIGSLPSPPFVPHTPREDATPKRLSVSGCRRYWRFDCSDC